VHDRVSYQHHLNSLANRMESTIVAVIIMLDEGCDAFWCFVDFSSFIYYLLFI